jgi:sortase (surface protein transpeptidase)
MTSRMALVLLRVATSGVLLAAVAASCGPDDRSPLSTSQPDLPALSLPPAPTPEVDAEVDAVAGLRADPRGEPARVVIPAIDVDADLVEVGLETDGSMQVPDFGLAGWYTEGPRPGHAGPAVIAAHVDSRAGPDVFYRLGDLDPGDEVHVVYDSGDTVTFLVASSEQTPKDELPVEAIWPTTSERLLALITCGGQFDRDVRHYRDNLIVYATPGTLPGDRSLR